MEDKENINKILSDKIQELNNTLQEVQKYPEQLKEKDILIDQLKGNLDQANQEFNQRMYEVKIESMETVQKIEEEKEKEIGKLKETLGEEERKGLIENAELLKQHAAELKTLNKIFDDKEAGVRAEIEKYRNEISLKA